MMRVYRIREKKLVLCLEKRLSGIVTGLEKIENHESNTDMILMSFRDAKMTLLEFSPDRYDFNTVSLHYFEKPEYKSETLIDYDSRLIIDPSSRAAALRVYNNYLAVLPFDEDRISRVLKFSDIDANVRNVIDICFMHDLHEPTVAVLYEPHQTWAGSLETQKDTCQVAIISLGSFPTVIHRVTDLPFDSLKVLSLPKPVGGILVLSVNCIIHIDQSSTTFGIALNSFSEEVTNWKFQKQLMLEISLENVKTIFYNGKILISVSDGDLYALSFKQKSRKVLDADIQLVGKFSICETICFSEDFVFIGSTLSDSVLYTTELKIDSKEENIPETMSMDDAELDDLYRTSAAVPNNEVTGELELTAIDRVRNIGMMLDMAIGKPHYPGENMFATRNDKFPELEVVVAGGEGSFGGLSILRQNISPKILSSFKMADATRIFSVKCESGEDHKFILISTQRSTLILESRAHDLHEMELSEFYLEGSTIYASEIFNNTLVLQVFSSGYKLVNSEARTVHEEMMDQVIVDCQSVDNYVVFLTQEGEVIFAECDGKELNGIEFLLTSVKVVAISVVVCNRSPVVACVDEFGTLYLGSFVEKKVIGVYPTFSQFPECLTPSGDPSSVIDSFVREIEICSWNDSLFLICRTKLNDIVMFQSFDFENETRFRRVKHGKVTREVLKDSEFRGDSTKSLIKFESIGGKTGVFCKGSQPFWICNVQGYIRLYPMSQDGGITCFSAFHSASCTEGLIFINDRNSLRIATLPKIELCAEWTLERVNFGECVHGVAYHYPSETYAVLTSSKVPFRFPKLTEDDENTVEEKRLPKMNKFSVKLVSPVTWEVVDSLEMEEYEQALEVRSLELESSMSSSGRKHFITIGTAMVKGEDTATRGNVWIIDVIDVVPEPGNPQTNHKLKLVCKKDLKGPVSSVASLNGKLLTCIGSKIMVHDFENTDEINGIAFIDVQMFANTAICVKNYILYGDIYKGVSFLAFQQNPTKIEVLGKDYDKMEAACVDCLISKGTMYFVAADREQSLHIMSYSPTNLMSLGGQKLLKRGVFQIGSNVTRLLRISKEEKIHSLLYGAVDGSIGVLCPVTDKLFKSLNSLFLKLSQFHQFAGLNVRAFRSPKNIKCVVDFDFCQSFCEMSRVHQEQVARLLNVDAEKILNDISIVYQHSNYFK